MGLKSRGRMEAEARDLTRRDRNKLRNQREILDAALEVFAEKGYHQASIQEIADRADFAVSTIYALFENKEDLYRKASIKVAKDCGTIFDEAMDRGETCYAKLVNFARAKGDVFKESPSGVQLLNNERTGALAGTPIPTPQGISAIYDKFMVRIRDLFADGIANGEFVDQDPELLAHALDSATNALLQLSLAQPDTYSYEDRVDDVIAIFFESVRRKGSK